MLSRLPRRANFLKLDRLMRVVEFELYRIDLQTRIPFKYGLATMTRMPEVFVRLTVDFERTSAVGISSDCLPPKWFTKAPEKPLEAEIEEMVAVITHALQASTEVSESTVFAFWQSLYAQQEAWATQHQVPPLLAHFGTSLVERALIDAFCRVEEMPFARAVLDNWLRIDLGAIHSELRGSKPSEFLPRRPLERVTARHTIGLADPLVNGDIAPEERVDDGLPQSLQACIRAYNPRHFKIKVSGKLESDLERLEDIARVIRGATPSDFRFSLDANEQFKTFDGFREYCQIVRRQSDLQDFFLRLLFVEQPLHRSVALDPQVESDLKAWPDRPPIIIDESDGTLDAVATALRRGYAGASHKNCKGVFKGIANACLLKKSLALLTGEDLCNIGPVALLQDLAVMATLGIESVERNGHHYHAGLSQFPAAIQQQVLENHPDLYCKSRKGWPTLVIGNGQIDLQSVNRAPFGVGFDLETSSLTRIV